MLTAMNVIPATTDDRHAPLAPEELSELIDAFTPEEPAPGEPPRTEPEAGGSRIVLLQLANEICRTLLTASDLRLGLEVCANNVARTLHASAVAIRVEGIGETPVEAVGLWNAAGSGGHETPPEFVAAVPIHHGDDTFGKLSIGELCEPMPTWFEPYVLEPFLEGVAREIAQCLSQMGHQQGEERRREQRLSDADTIGVAAVDAGQRITTWSRGAKCILGWMAEDVIGREFTGFITAADRQLWRNMLADAFRGRRPVPLSTRFRRWDRGDLPVRIEALPIAGGNGVEEVSLLIHDESRAHRLQRLVDATAGVADVLDRCSDRQVAARDGCAATNSSSVAAGPMLREVGNALHWSRGELWLLNDAGDEWELAGSWTADGVNVEALETVTSSPRKTGGDQFLSLIQQQRRVLRFEDIAVDAPDPRNIAAGQCGLHDAVGLPVMIDGDVAGAVLFFGSPIPEVDAATACTLEAIAAQLALFLRNERLRGQLNETELNALQSKKMEAMGRLAGGIVHDFNNLLTIIFGLSEMITGTLDEDAPQRAMVSEIEKASHRAAALTQQLLAFSRKQPLKSAILNVNVRIDELKSMLRRLVDERIELTFGTTDVMHKVRFDPIQFEQVLLNLVVNARDAIDGPGSITVGLRNAALSVAKARQISAARPGEFVVVSVTDTGCGMDEKTRARVLEPFFTTKEQGKGTGMGLATVHETVQQAGGFLSIASQPGEGTTIDVYLPRTNDLPETMQADVIPADAQRGDETILLVEGEDVLRSLTTRMLEARGYTVLPASDGPQALDLLKRNRGTIDLLISDVMMPGMTGPDLVAKARSLGGDVKVLFASSYISPELSEDNQLAGTPLIQKPFTSSALGSEIRRLLDGGGD